MLHDFIATDSSNLSSTGTRRKAGDCMTDRANSEKVFKLNQADIRGEITKDLAENLAKFNDPVVLGVLVSRLIEERENTNRILKTLLARIEALETQAAGSAEAVEAPMLPKIDQDILAYLGEGPKTAEDVRKKFGYKGRNAASARMSRLYNLGVVVRRQVGKQVYFTLA